MSEGWEFGMQAKHNGYRGVYGLGAESDVQPVKDIIVRQCLKKGRLSDDADG